MRLDRTGADSRPRHWTTLAAAMLAAACLDGENPADTIGSAEPGADFGADPAHLRAGPPRLRLGSVSRDGEMDFHNIVGGVVRDEFDVEHVLIVPLPAGARSPGT